MSITVPGIIPNPNGIFKVSKVKMRNKEFQIVSILEVPKLSDGKTIVCVYKALDKKNRMLTFFNNGRFLKDTESDFDLVTVLEKV